MMICFCCKCRAEAYAAMSEEDRRSLAKTKMTVYSMYLIALLFALYQFLSVQP